MSTPGFWRMIYLVYSQQNVSKQMHFRVLALNFGFCRLPHNWLVTMNTSIVSFFMHEYAVRFVILLLLYQCYNYTHMTPVSSHDRMRCSISFLVFGAEGSCQLCIKGPYKN